MQMLIFEPANRAWPFHQYTPEQMNMVVIVGGIESPEAGLFRRRVEKCQSGRRVAAIIQGIRFVNPLLQSAATVKITTNVFPKYQATALLRC